MGVRDEVYRDRTGVAEPLAASAALAYRLAQRCCRKKAGCGFIHAVWQYRRLLGVTKTIRVDGPFLVEQMRRRAETGEHERVLISGCADYAILAYVAAAYRTAGVTPRITVMDLCPTPVLLNRWYARWADLSIETAVASILDFDRPGQFDVICTHSFLDHLTPLDRQALMRRWHRLLRPGGVVVTSNRIRPDTWQSSGIYGEEGSKRLIARADAAAQEYMAQRPGADFDAVFGMDRAKLLEAIGRTRTSRRYYLKSEEQLRGLFEEAGFSLEVLEPQTATEQQADRPGNEPDDKSSVRMRVVAVRGPQPGRDGGGASE